MTVWDLWPYVSAIILGNALSFAFFMAAMKASKLQKNGAKDDELPAWVYAGLIAAPVIGAIGFALLK